MKYKTFFDELPTERIGEIYNISKEIKFNNLSYYFKNKKISPIIFINFRAPVYICNQIKNCDTSIEKIEDDQKQIISNLYEVTAGNPKYKSKVQLNTIENIRDL